MVSMRNRRRGDDEKGPELIDEGAFVEPKARRAWNALHEEARARRSPLVESQAIPVAGVGVDVAIVTGPEDLWALAVESVMPWPWNRAVWNFLGWMWAWRHSRAAL